MGLCRRVQGFCLHKIVPTGKKKIKIKMEYNEKYIITYLLLPSLVHFIYNIWYALVVLPNILMKLV